MKIQQLLLPLLASLALAGSAWAQPDKTETGGGSEADGRMKQGLVAHYFKDPEDWDGNWTPKLHPPTVDALDYTFGDYVYSRKEPLINHLFIRRGWFSVRWIGYLKVPPGNSSAENHKDGKWSGDLHKVTLELWMDDGARLFVDGQKLIDDWRPCPETAPESHRTVDVTLSSGYHRIIVEYFQGLSLDKNDPDPAKAFWSSADLGIKHQVIPASHFFHSEEDLEDYQPSQGLSAQDLTDLNNGEAPVLRQEGPPVGKGAQSAGGKSGADGKEAGRKHAKAERPEHKDAGAKQEKENEKAQALLKKADEAGRKHEKEEELRTLCRLASQHGQTESGREAKARLERSRKEPQAAGMLRYVEAEECEKAGDRAGAERRYRELAEDPAQAHSLACLKAKKRLQALEQEPETLPKGAAAKGSQEDREAQRLLNEAKNYKLNRLNEKARQSLQELLDRYPNCKYAQQARGELGE